MSTSHDPQFGSHPSAPAHGGHGAPAQIVWQDTAPGAPAAWTGPGAFDEEPAANGATDGAANDTAAAGESDAQQSPSLSDDRFRSPHAGPSNRPTSVFENPAH